MSGKAKLKIEEDVSPNLVPMIDIMFLLLLFFMLSADMGQRELEEVHLPKAISVKEDKENKKKEEVERVTINVYHDPKINCGEYRKGDVCRKMCDPNTLKGGHWYIGIKGADFVPAGTDIERLVKRLKKEADMQKGTDAKNPNISERRVMIRADASSPYEFAQRVMNSCAMAGIYKIEVGAAAPPIEKKKRSE